jgi:hypothetical protein
VLQASPSPGDLVSRGRRSRPDGWTGPHRTRSGRDGRAGGRPSPMQPVAIEFEVVEDRRSGS